MSLKAKKSSTPSRYDADFRAALPALKRAAKKAKETAIQSNTPLALWQDGRVKTVKPSTRGKKT